MAAPDYLRIGRFRVDCLVPRDHPAPELARSRLAEVVEDLVPLTLSSVISRSFQATDESLWFVRELHLAVDLNVSIDTEHLAQSFAAQTARSLLDEMSFADAKNVVRFDNPAQLLAAFLADLAEGRAWQRWYYRRFDGLRLLPLSAALRTALCDDIRNSFAAMRYLGTPLVAKIVGCLTDADAQCILRTVRSSERGGTENITEELLGTVLHAFRRLSIRRAFDARTSLLLLIEINRSKVAGEILPSSLCEGIVGLARVVSEAGESSRHVLAALARRDDAVIAEWAGHEEMGAMLPLFHLSDSLRTRIIEEFRETLEPDSHPDKAGTPAQTTQFGGAFFLLPLLDRLPFGDNEIRMPNISDDDLAVLHWLVLIKCFGQGCAPAAARDPVLRAMTAVPIEVPTGELLERWQQQVNARQLYALLAGLRRYRKTNQSIGDDPSILVNAGHTAAVRLDPARGYWISLSASSKMLSRPADLPEPMRDAIDRLAEDVEYFALPDAFGLSDSHDSALTVISQGLMKDFAWRLPGFSWSSPRFLFENFLNCDASVEAKDETFRVTVGKSSLSLILNVTGIHRQRFELSWLKGRRFELYPETQ